MHIEPIRLNSNNKFLQDYKKQSDELMKYFDYLPYDKDVYTQRVQDLKERTFDRDGLANVLKTLNKRWNGSNATFQNIEMLKNEESVVVIGGQQAGLLSGPLYTIHKIISIIQFAKEQEQKLNIPVIPVFWIAGEDHDYDEVNHVFLADHLKWNKVVLDNQGSEKASVSHRNWNKQEAQRWLDEVFHFLDETAYTKDLYARLVSFLEKSVTLVDFFANFIHDLFKDSGIVLIDSGDALVRKLESRYFQELIQQQSPISEGVYTALNQLRQKGYPISVDVEANDGHLFFHNQNERILLKRENQDWVGKNYEYQLSEAEILEIAHSNPEKLSNNVVTRPIMQEKLFPTLAFLGGPSEVAYWSILKPAFHSVAIKMPPVLPRVSITFMERKVQKLLNKYGISASSAIEYGISKEKQNWIAQQANPPVSLLGEQLKSVIAEAHQPIRSYAKTVQDDLGMYAEKNLQYLFDHVDQLTHRIEKQIAGKYEINLKEYDYIQLHVRPQNGLQERIWNIIYFLNHYGDSIISELTTNQIKVNDQHYIVYI
ncbi:bacillithiol biosynthesis cysteine-adding enzyme BshC [Gracilibacillus dipsosauri]|uniref:Putative cysteine ligase BshC n=1 Tax=Gracilibacillus dipsosauri TaxID=178340 RepID=A0A317KZI2_9BACI|nr:bacillithiol biosynthesis cysteine-adding enzyme BshC [Gracilibacillus dipsosauri]PWU68962.1 bacillithiol biosynthesis cysteine-adding enzyme BshC [Gracilibacillus dipsosauri]